MPRLKKVLSAWKKYAQMAKDNGVKIRGYVSTVFGCPYAGEMESEKLLEVMDKMFKTWCL